MYYFHRRCSCNYENAQELAQEAFLRAYRNLPKLKELSSFKAWFMTICKNLVLDSIRNEERKVVNLPIDSLTSSSVEMDFSKKMVIRDALNALPQRQREAMEYRYHWDLSMAEIAGIMKIPEGTVKSDLFQARVRLLEILEGESTVE
jgi:RNA polymerase sigma-70 factor (ECF subfamily)